MPRNRDPIREASSAEASLVLLVRRVWRAVEGETRRLVTRALAEDDPRVLDALERLFERALEGPAVRSAIERAAARIVGDLRKQVRALLPERLVVPGDAGAALAELWVEETRGNLRLLFLGRAVTDESVEREDGPMRSVLTRIRQAASRARATVSSVIDAAVSTVGAIAKRVVAGARSLFGRANASIQQAVGITHYTWITKGDNRVRPLHRILHGSRQAWAQPPIVDKYGHRKHPGEDWGCRCIAVPIVP